LPQLFKALLLAVSFGLALLPGHAGPPVKPPAPTFSQALAHEAPRAGFLKFDGQTVAEWTAVQARLDAERAAELAAEQAAEQAREAAAAAAARQAATVTYRPAFTSSPGVAAVKQLIRQAFAPLGQAAVDWGLRVAACESGYNPNSYNPDGASGVFQFMPSTFRATPYGSQNIFDATANVDAAAWYYGRHGGGAWSCK